MGDRSFYDPNVDNIFLKPMRAFVVKLTANKCWGRTETPQLPMKSQRQEGVQRAARLRSQQFNSRLVRGSAAFHCVDAIRFDK